MDEATLPGTLRTELSEGISVGVPPRVYLMQLRMERACEMLETTDLTVTEIAQEDGYSSNQARTQVFVKHRHMNPSGYRRASR